MTTQKLTFGEMVRIKRARNGLTLEEFGKLSGFSKDTIHRWETSVLSWKDIPYYKVEKIASALKCSVEDLKGD